MGRPIGQLEKSLASLTIAIKRGADERHAALADGYTGEHVQQIHVDLSGVAASDWGFADKDVNFLMPFVYAPAQRQVPFEVPHFTYGIEFKVPPAGIVAITAHVLSWRQTPEGWITGAKVRFIAMAPGSQPVANTVTKPREGAPIRAGATSGGGVSFTATAHLSFEGYATYAEGEEFDQ